MFKEKLLQTLHYSTKHAEQQDFIDIENKLFL